MDLAGNVGGMIPHNISVLFGKFLKRFKKLQANHCEKYSEMYFKPI